MTAVRFQRRGSSHTIAFAFNPAVVELIKQTVPGYARQWIPERKEWEVDATWVDSLAATLLAAGHTVAGLNDRTATRYPPKSDPSRWAHTLLSRLDPGLRQAVYRALSRVLHPDVGGDPTLQRELNDAFNETRKPK
jgi:hypothetical protein